jgi:hypothetical protein
MGRLHHLKQTLPINIINTSSYPNCEFIVLNYGSRDGMHDWVKNNLNKYIETGKLKYYRTQMPEYFVATHSKNIAHRQAVGDIICNIDADNYIVPGFVEFLAHSFKKYNCLVCSPSLDSMNNHGSCGKIAVRREHFYSVNGYDENLNLGWGWDDTNFQYRVKMQNGLFYINTEKKFCRTIDHSNEDRVKNFKDKDIEKTKLISIESLYELEKNKNYIANVNKNWGVISDLSSNI